MKLLKNINLESFCWEITGQFDVRFIKADLVIELVSTSIIDYFLQLEGYLPESKIKLKSL
jgi:hypothetical protein